MGAPGAAVQAAAEVGAAAAAAAAEVAAPGAALLRDRSAASARSTAA